MTLLALTDPVPLHPVPDAETAVLTLDRVVDEGEVEGGELWVMVTRKRDWRSELTGREG